MPDKPKTRLAPTPSGFLHLGNAFNFITTALVAHFEDAAILLRIDDLDQARYRPEYAKDIFRTLDMLGIHWDQGPESIGDLEDTWSQKHRLELYRTEIQKLWDNELLFPCECSRSDVVRISGSGDYPGTCIGKSISVDKKVSWRLITDQQIFSMDQWGREESVAVSLPGSVQHFVIRRRDAVPSYQLASVIDDISYKVNIIVRGEDLYASSLAQLYLSEKMHATAFGETRFFHHRLLVGRDGEKLSKTVLQQPRPLVKDMNASEIFRAYSGFIGLSTECLSLKELKESVSPSLLQSLRSRPDYSSGS